MKRFALWLLWLTLLPLLPMAASAVDGSIDEGIEYRLIEPALPTNAPEGKVEVVEFFWYGCPHCFKFEPLLQQWLKEQGERVVYVRKPSVLNPSWGVHARAYYTAQALGVADELHQPLFDAIHVEKRKLNSEDQLAEFFAEHGVDPLEFRKIFRSFYVETNLRRDRDLNERCCPSGVPSIVIDGKYFTDTTFAGGYQGLLKVMSHLVDQELAGK